MSPQKKVQALLDAIPKPTCFAEYFFEFQLRSRYRAGGYEQCLQFAFEVKENLLFEINPAAVAVLGNCFDHLTSEQKSKWTAFFKTIVGEDYFESARNPTVSNYKYLLRTLDENGISLVVMSYPTVSIESIKWIESFPHKAKIEIVDNQKIFQDEIAKTGYDSLFVDRFNKSFGHATTAGNALLARQAAAAILLLRRDLN